MSEEEIAHLLKEVDINHDGQVDYNEFLTMMKGISGDMSKSVIGGTD